MHHRNNYKSSKKLSLNRKRPRPSEQDRKENLGKGYQELKINVLTIRQITRSTDWKKYVSWDSAYEATLRPGSESYRGIMI